MQEAEKILSKGTSLEIPWDGPVTGPLAQTAKKIVFVAMELRNGGILGAAQGAKEASRVIGWQMQIFDAKGDEADLQKIWKQIEELRPHGVILGGMDSKKHGKALNRLAELGIKLVGWHVGPDPGPIPATSVAMNVTSDVREVSNITAMAAIVDSNGKAGVVIFTDQRFGIARTKARLMEEAIRRCKGCKILEVRNVSLSNVSKEMPDITRNLLSKYGSQWTHALGINDLYFDYAAPILASEGLPLSGRLHLLSAGDGSSSAYQRIMGGVYQIGTVPEPLNLQGWQLVDELNRLFAGQSVSGYVSPVHWVMMDNVMGHGGAEYRFDPENNYRKHYKSIWLGQ
ncbi:MAG: substrate-binding domain-containing protein [Magnetococcales bacterium]|nr:substrate-binding domain-containing protein [Magnetococcales bacterium]